MNVTFPAPDLSLLENWLHLYLYHFRQPHFLKSLLFEESGHDIKSTIQHACRQIPDARIALQQPWVSVALQWTESAGNTVLPLYCPRYPPLLLQIPDPPAVLFVKGSASSLSLPQIAMVGSRHPSPDGRTTASALAASICRAGFTVTSGLAYGIDAQCHQSALDNQGSTIAVLGSGVDSIYPQKHRSLAQAITGRGALVSEFLPTAHARGWHFPLRNRIISGLAHGVLVVEAAQRSGTLITARLAADQGREVFAVPGSIRNVQTRGCHWLLKNGAKLVEGLDDILEELPALLAWVKAQSQSTSAEDTCAVGAGTLDGLEKQDVALLDEIGFDPVSLERLVTMSTRTINEVMGSLATLELAGLIASESGAYRRLISG